MRSNNIMTLYRLPHFTLYSLSPNHTLSNTHLCPKPSHSDSCNHSYLISCSYVYSGVSPPLPSTSSHHPLTFHLQQRYYHLHLFTLLYVIYIYIYTLFRKPYVDPPHQPPLFVIRVIQQHNTHLVVYVTLGCMTHIRD